WPLARQVSGNLPVSGDLRQPSSHLYGEVRMGALRRLRVMLLCSGFNGLSQRAWIELREAGHHVEVQLATDAEHVLAAVRAMDPDLVICPFLRERVPAQAWTVWPTIIVHPGPTRDRGPCSLYWALMDAENSWGVTALQAVEEMDAGP